MPGSGGASRRQTVAIWIAAAAVAFFLAELALRFGDVVDGIYMNSDFASTPVIAELLGGKGAGDVTLGNYPWLEPLYVLRLTRWLPDHRELWSLLPFAGYVLTVGLFAWTLRRAVSARAAVVAALALAAPAPLVLGLLGAPANRLPTLAHAILLAAFLIGVPALASWPRWGRALWAAGLALSLAPGFASDPLLLVWGILPFLTAVAVGRHLDLVPRRDALLAAGSCLGGVLIGVLAAVLAAAAGVHRADFPIGLARPGDWAGNAWDAMVSAQQFLHGEFVLDGLGDPLAVAVSATAALATVGFPLLCVAVFYRLRGMLGDDERTAGQRLLLAFWAISLAGALGALLLTDVAAGVSSVRYLLVVWPAALALALIAWGARSYAAIAGLAVACAAIGIVQFERGHYDSQGPPLEPEEIAGVERFVAAHGLDHGYAGYWDAAALTYHSDFEAKTYPVVPCGPAPDGLCQFNLHTMDSWYEPKPGARTFFVEGTRDVPQNPGPPPARWGRPFAVETAGRLRLYAYDFDIASVLEGGRPAAHRVR